jgi:hypothetical protein
MRVNAHTTLNLPLQPPLRPKLLGILSPGLLALVHGGDGEEEDRTGGDDNGGEGVSAGRADGGAERDGLVFERRADRRRSGGFEAQNLAL